LTSSQSGPSVANQRSDAPTGKTWRVSLATRILMGFLAAFMFGLAALMFSLPLAYGRADHSVDWIVALVALALTGFGVFASFAFIAVVRTRVTLEAATLAATVVDGHNWLLVPHFRSVRLAFADIRSVERRTEMFRTLGLSAMREALSIVTSDGERVGLFSNTLGSADTLPLDEVASAIAAAVGLSVTDDGTVRARGSGLYGAASSSWTERALDESNASKARRTVMRTVQICTALLLLSFILRAFF
jgi:hypothetical protein